MLLGVTNEVAEVRAGGAAIDHVDGTRYTAPRSSGRLDLWPTSRSDIQATGAKLTFTSAQDYSAESTLASA